MEKVILNGVGLASVRNFLKTSSMVELLVWHSRNLETNKDYNFEYTVYNKLSNQDYIFKKSYEGLGGDILKEAEQKFSEEVGKNEITIKKVKEHLGI